MQKGSLEAKVKDYRSKVESLREAEENNKEMKHRLMEYEQQIKDLSL